MNEFRHSFFKIILAFKYHLFRKKAGEIKDIDFLIMKIIIYNSIKRYFHLILNVGQNICTSINEPKSSHLIQFWTKNHCSIKCITDIKLFLSEKRNNILKEHMTDQQYMLFIILRHIKLPEKIIIFFRKMTKINYADIISI